MAASFAGGAESGYDDDSDEGSEEGGGGGAYGEAPFRFRTSEVAPWGEGDRPLIKVGGWGECVRASARWSRSVRLAFGTL